MQDTVRSDIPDTLIFLHIPKNAGRTFESVLERQYAAKSIFDLYGYGQTIENAVSVLTGLPAAEKERIRLIKGHYQFGLHTLLPQSATYIAFLRDPVDRVVSHYHYVSRDVNHPLHHLVTTKKMSLYDYVSSGVSLELNNGQTRMISGNEHRDSYGQCSGALLDQAKSNIDHHFSVVGLVERFDESLALMSCLFGWKKVYYAKTNVAARRQLVADIDAETIRLIKKYNDLDRELYRFAAEKFDRMIAACDETFLQVLNRLKWDNMLYRPIASLKRTGDVARKLIHRCGLRK